MTPMIALHTLTALLDYARAVEADYELPADLKHALLSQCRKHGQILEPLARPEHRAKVGTIMDELESKA